MKHLYEGHLGNLYSSDIKLELKDLYCSTCGDFDSYIGYYETLKDFWTMIKDKCSINDSGGYSLQYIFPFMCNEFDLDIDIPYSNYIDKESGFCNLTDNQIIQLIKSMIY